MKKPQVMDLTIVEHRVRALSAYHVLLSEGLDEQPAKITAINRAMKDWDEYVYRNGTLYTRS